MSKWSKRFIQVWALMGFLVVSSCALTGASGVASPLFQDFNLSGLALAVGAFIGIFVLGAFGYFFFTGATVISILNRQKLDDIEASLSRVDDLEQVLGTIVRIDKETEDK